MTRRALVALVGAATLLCPWPMRSAPRWELQVLDADGEPVPYILARQQWRDPSAMGHRLEHSRLTDAQGRVLFPARWAWASSVERGARLLRHDLSCGLTYAEVYVWDLGYTTGVADYVRGKPIPRVVRLEVDTSDIRPVIGRAARLAHFAPFRGRPGHCPGGM